MKMTMAESAVWGAAFMRALDRGDDHGYAAFVADNAVLRYRRRHKKRKATQDGGPQ